MATRRLVLVGSGHAHLHVLRELARRPIADVETVLVAPGDHHHPAMMPGYLAGRYTLDDLRVDLSTLARAAGATFVPAVADRIVAGDRVVVAGGTRIPFDFCSVAVGCDVGGADVPGVREHALALRPAGRAAELRARVDELVARAGGASVVVVGGVAAAAEVALALRHRLHVAGATGGVSLIERDAAPAPELDPAMRALVAEILRERGVSLVLGGRVTAVDASGVVLHNGATVPADLVVWMNGSTPPSLFAASGLPTDPAGRLLVDRSMRVVDGAPVWAAGDCVVVQDFPDAARWGDYGRREAPTLDRSLRAALGQGRPGRFRPQQRGLTLLDTGGGWALMSWKGIHRHSRWACRLKDMLDRRVVRRFRGSDETRDSAS